MQRVAEMEYDTRLACRALSQNRPRDALGPLSSPSCGHYNAVGPGMPEYTAVRSSQGVRAATRDRVESQSNNRRQDFKYTDELIMVVIKVNGTPLRAFST